MRAETRRPRSVNGRGPLGILNVQDWLAGLDKGGKRLALGKLDALLVDGEMDEIQHLGDDVAGILQPNGHVVGAGLGMQKLQIVDGILLREVQSVVVLLVIAAH